MEPNLPSPRFEQGGTSETYQAPAVERAPTLPNPERSDPRTERQEAVSAATAVAVDVTTVPVLPTPVALPTTDDSTAIIADTPAVAADDDLIEKEWVEKAKKILMETRDDPYRREEAVSQLQKDYLRKRYGKELGATE